LAAGSRCTISVRFSPTATGTRTGTLEIADNANGSPQTVTLTGTGR
jgi:Cep192 domain 4